MQALLRAVGRPLAAPSANASGSISPTRAEHVLKSLGGRIPLIIDGGPTERGLESTIVAATRRTACGCFGPARSTSRPRQAIKRTRSKRRASSRATMRRRSRCGSMRQSPKTDEYLIGFGPVAGDANLSPSATSIEAAARLFDLLHQADASPTPRIAVAPVPNAGLGAAINDRLAPRCRLSGRVQRP